MTNKPKKTPEELRAIRQQVGRKGGQATRDRHGREHYSEIGKKGAATTNEKLHGSIAPMTPIIGESEGGEDDSDR